MDIDKITQKDEAREWLEGFSSLLDIDKITPVTYTSCESSGFSSLLDIDKITLKRSRNLSPVVLVLCWILIKLHYDEDTVTEGEF